MTYKLQNFTLETFIHKNKYVAFLTDDLFHMTVRVSEEEKSFDNSLRSFTINSLLNIEKLIDSYTSQALELYPYEKNYNLERIVIDATDWACDLHYDAMLEDYLSL